MTRSYPIVGVLAQEEDIIGKKVYFFHGTYKRIFVNAYKKRHTGGIFSIVEYTSRTSKYDIVYLATQEPILAFRTNGTDMFYGTTFAKVEALKPLAANIQQMVYSGLEENADGNDKAHSNHSNHALMRAVRGKMKLPKCHRLEEFPEGTMLLMVAIKQVEFRKRKHYVMEFENLPNIYLSNYWLEEEITNSNVDLNYKIKILIDALRCTPNKHKEVRVFIK